MGALPYLRLRTPTAASWGPYDLRVWVWGAGEGGEAMEARA